MCWKRPVASLIDEINVDQGLLNDESLSVGPINA